MALESEKLFETDIFCTNMKQYLPEIQPKQYEISSTDNRDETK